jgi:hypothetical protein
MVKGDQGAKLDASGSGEKIIMHELKFFADEMKTVFWVAVNV